MIAAGILRTHSVIRSSHFVAVFEPDGLDFASINDADIRHYARLLGTATARDPYRIRYYDARQLLLLFGEPDLRRREGRYEQWQYRSASCVMNIFVEQDVMGGGYAQLQVADILFSSRRQRSGSDAQLVGLQDVAACYGSNLLHLRL